MCGNDHVEFTDTYASSLYMFYIQTDLETNIVPSSLFFLLNKGYLPYLR